MDALCEAVESGTLFIDTSGKNILPDPGFVYAPTTMREKAAKEFVTSWSHLLAAPAKIRMLQHPPVKVVDELINHHGLVVIVKRPANVVEAEGDVSIYSAPQQKFRTFTVDGIDGILTYQDVNNLIRSGKVGRDTLVRQRGKTHPRPASRWPEFEPAFKSTATGSLATGAGPLNKALQAPLGQVKSRFIYASAQPMPKFTAMQVAKITELFGQQPQDLFYRVGCLSNCTKVEDQVIAAKLFSQKRPE